MSTITASAPTKFCDGCLRERPLTEFRRVSREKGYRARKCRLCHNRAERLRAREKRARKRHRKLTSFCAEVSRTESDPRMAYLVNRIVGDFGGIEKFAAAWSADFAEARRTRPDTKFVADTFRAIARLMLHVERNQPQPTADWSDQELEDFMIQTFLERAQSHPEELADALRQLGWQATPPSCANC